MRKLCKSNPFNQIFRLFAFYFVNLIQTLILNSMKQLLLAGTIGLFSMTCFAQEPASTIQPVKLGDNVSVKLGGFARADYFINSRKGTENVDGLFFIWPDPAVRDANGMDLSEKVNQNLSATPTRFSALFTGPDALGAKASSYFEFDFTGGNSNYLLFRQGWVKLDWTKTSLQIGRNWHPLQGPVVPSMVSMNFESPFNVFCRGEQVRFTYKPGKVTILAAVFMQSGHSSFGPNGQGFTYQRNAMLPDLNLQFHYTDGGFTAGIMGEYKLLQPKEVTNYGQKPSYHTYAKIASHALAVYGQYKKGLFLVKGNAMLGQNLAEMAMQGGYARMSQDTVTGHEKYTTGNALTTWINFVYGDKVKFGLFGGYQKNLGLSDQVTPSAYLFYGRAEKIGSMMRIAPSVSYYSGRMVFQVEPELTSAAYGTVDLTDKGKIINTKSVYNRRLVLSVSYFF